MICSQPLGSCSTVACPCASLDLWMVVRHQLRRRQVTTMDDEFRFRFEREIDNLSAYQAQCCH